jgi:hypothetical protein
MIKSSRMIWLGYVAHMDKLTNPYNILIRKPQLKRQHERYWQK